MEIKLCGIGGCSRVLVDASHQPGRPFPAALGALPEGNGVGRVGWGGPTSEGEESQFRRERTTNLTNLTNLPTRTFVRNEKFAHRGNASAPIGRLHFGC